jgi:Tfp pilus assembly protein PilW
MFQFEIELVGLIVLTVASITFFVRQKFRVDAVEAKNKELLAFAADLKAKQETDHTYLLALQAEKEKALWSEMRSFRDTMIEMVKGIGRLEGKIDTINGRPK